jgi:hypothetical protein
LIWFYYSFDTRYLQFYSDIFVTFMTLHSASCSFPSLQSDIRIGIKAQVSLFLYRILVRFAFDIP